MKLRGYLVYEHAAIGRFLNENLHENFKSSSLSSETDYDITFDIYSGRDRKYVITISKNSKY